MRVSHDRHIVTYDTSSDVAVPGRGSTGAGKYRATTTMSGVDFLMLRPGLQCAGPGETRFRNVTFRAL
jgi:hypothetical protein